MGKNKTSDLKWQKTKKILIRVGVSLAAVLIVAIAIFGSTYSSGWMQRKVTAVSVGDQKISIAEFRLYYLYVRNDYITQYGSMLGISNTPSLDSSPCLMDKTKTWGDVFTEQTVSQIEEISVMYAESQKKNFELGGTYLDQYNQFLTSFKSGADQAKMSLDQYANYIYGAKTSYDDVKTSYYKRYMAYAYYTELLSSYSFTDSEIQKYYESHKDEYDLVDYRYFTFPYKTVTYTAPEKGKTLPAGAPKSQEEADAMTKANKDAAKKQADAMSALITNEKSFIEQAKNFASAADKQKYSSDSATLYTGAKVSGAAGPLSEWYVKAERKAGDRAVIDNTVDNGYTVIYFLNRQRTELQTATVRHILLKTQTPAADATDAKKAEIIKLNDDVKTHINEIYNEWKLGAKTEDSFADLAKKYSEDSNASVGGVYNEFAKGSMVATFDTWSFDTSRKAGDTGIVQTEYGYHLLYYVAPGRPSWMVGCESSMKTEAFSKFINDSLKTTYPTSRSAYAIKLARA